MKNIDERKDIKNKEDENMMVNNEKENDNIKIIEGEENSEIYSSDKKNKNDNYIKYYNEDNSNELNENDDYHIEDNENEINNYENYEQNEDLENGDINEKIYYEMRMKMILQMVIIIMKKYPKYKKKIQKN